MHSLVISSICGVGGILMFGMCMSTILYLYNADMSFIKIDLALLFDLWSLLCLLLLQSIPDGNCDLLRCCPRKPLRWAIRWRV
jgi:hypothetical protein